MYLGLILCISIRHNKLTYSPFTPIHFPLSTYAFLKLFYLYVCFLTPSQKNKVPRRLWLYYVHCYIFSTEIVTRDSEYQKSKFCGWLVNTIMGTFFINSTLFNGFCSVGPRYLLSNNNSFILWHYYLCRSGISKLFSVKDQIMNYFRVARQTVTVTSIQISSYGAENAVRDNT